ncbi:MAG: excisionase family DNA-binding protein [Vulcanimicrobiaceae bacterium]
MPDSAAFRTGVEVIQPSPADEEALKQLAAAILAVPLAETPHLQGPDDGPLPLPPSLYKALRDAVAILLNGDAVVISPLHRRLTTTEAGDLLGVSRQYLTRLIDRGEIPCDRTGRHRRLRLSEVLEYKRRSDEERQKMLDQLTAEAAESGAYG